MGASHFVRNTHSQAVDFYASDPTAGGNVDVPRRFLTNAIGTTVQDLVPNYIHILELRSRRGSCGI